MKRVELDHITYGSKGEYFGFSSLGKFSQVKWALRWDLNCKGEIIPGLEAETH